MSASAGPRAALQELLNDGSDLSRATAAQLDDHALEVALSRPRQAVPERRLIQTVNERGYRIAVEG